MQWRFLLATLFILLTSCSTFDFTHDHVSVTHEPTPISRVAVFDFAFDRPERGRIDRGKIERAPNAGEIVAGILTEHLLDAGLYQIIGQQRVKTLLRQNNLTQTDLLARSDWGRIRELLGVEAVVLGVVIEYGDWRSRLNWGGISVFNARLVALDSGQVLWSISANRNTALVNAAGATHAGAAIAVDRLKERLNP